MFPISPLPVANAPIKAPSNDINLKSTTCPSNILPKLSPVGGQKQEDAMKSKVIELFGGNSPGPLDLTGNMASPPYSSQSNSHQDHLANVEASLTIMYYSSHLLVDIPINPSPLLLQVAILSNNSITEFGALQACKNLIEIDLSHNAITKTPREAFFSSMMELSILRLDNNQITGWRSILGLQGSDSLIYLALQSNPFTKNEKYRPFVVNLVPNLKGLDGYAVSDEELISDKKFIEGWGGEAPRYELPNFVMARGWEEEKELDDFMQLKYASNVARVVENIHDACSPTRTIQNAYRAYRFRLEEFEMSSGAAKAIQKIVSHRICQRRLKNQLDELLIEEGYSSLLVSQREGRRHHSAGVIQKGYTALRRHRLEKRAVKTMWKWFQQKQKNFKKVRNAERFVLACE